MVEDAPFLTSLTVERAIQRRFGQEGVVRADHDGYACGWRSSAGILPGVTVWSFDIVCATCGGIMTEAISVDQGVTLADRALDPKRVIEHDTLNRMMRHRKRKHA